MAIVDRAYICPLWSGDLFFDKDSEDFFVFDGLRWTLSEPRLSRRNPSVPTVYLYSPSLGRQLQKAAQRANQLNWRQE
jgi:hypothetical protein